MLINPDECIECRQSFDGAVQVAVTGGFVHRDECYDHYTAKKQNTIRLTEAERKR